jgi:hypothetical protein
MLRPIAGPNRRATSLALILLITSSLLLCASPAHAQGGDPPPAPATSQPAPARPRGRHETRLYFGMFTTHLKEPTVSLHNNWLIAVSYRGFFGGTFLNTFGRRAFTGGLQRTLVSHVREPLAASLGVRLGVVTGYDGRFMELARETPVLPLISAYGNVDVKRIGVEVSYTFVVVSIAMSYRF